MPLRVRQLVPRRAVDRLIFTDVDIVGIVRDVEIGAVGDVGIVLVGGGGDDGDVPVLLRLGDGLLRPGARLDIAGLAVFHQVHRHHRKLQRTAALNEQHLVVIGNAHQRAQVGLGLVGNLLEHLGAVAHLHDAHAAAAVVHHLVADLLQNGLRHHGGAGGEVECTVILHLHFLLFC